VRVLGHARGLDRLLQLLDFGGAVLALAQLLLDLAHLLAQHVLALALVEFLLRLVADLLRQAQHLDARAEQLEHLVEALPQVEALEHRLLFLVLHVEQVGDHVAQLPRRLDRPHHAGELLGRPRQQVDRLGRLLLELHEARFQLGAARIGLGLVRLDHGDARDEERPALEEFQHAEAFLPLHHHVVHALARRNHAHDLAGGADPVQVVRGDGALLRVALQEKTHLLVAARGLACRGHR